MSNCKNCGAPYTGELKCAWCGTVHGDAAEALLKREIEAAESRIEQLKMIAIRSYILSQPFGGPTAPAYALEPVYGTCCTLQEARERAIRNIWSQQDRINASLANVCGHLDARY